MKKLLSFLLSILLVIQIAPVAVAQTNAEVHVESTTAMRGETVSITISVQDYVEAKSIYIVPVYDEDILEIVSGTWLVSGVLADDWSAAFGDAAIAFAENTNINTDIFELVFKVKDNAAAVKNTSVSCEIVIKTMNGKEEVPVAITVTPGQVTMPTNAMLGDVNDDSRINFKDAILILQYASGRIVESDLSLDVADVNADGRYNFKDAILMLQLASGRIEAFPV